MGGRDATECGPNPGADACQVKHVPPCLGRRHLAVMRMEVLAWLRLVRANTIICAAGREVKIRGSKAPSWQFSTAVLSFSLSLLDPARMVDRRSPFGHARCVTSWRSTPLRACAREDTYPVVASFRSLLRHEAVSGALLGLNPRSKSVRDRKTETPSARPGNGAERDDATGNTRYRRSNAFPGCHR